MLCGKENVESHAQTSAGNRGSKILPLDIPRFARLDPSLKSQKATQFRDPGPRNCREKGDFEHLPTNSQTDLSQLPYSQSFQSTYTPPVSAFSDPLYCLAGTCPPRPCQAPHRVLRTVQLVCPVVYGNYLFRESSECRSGVEGHRCQLGRPKTDLPSVLRSMSDWSYRG